MTLEYFQNLQNQQQQASNGPYGGVATGHVPRQPNLGLGPNRYVPPTFNWGRGGMTGNQPQYDQMNWNQMQDYYLPSQNGNRGGSNQYMGALQQMLAQFGSQYGDPNRRPTLPQFGPYGGAGGGEGFNPFNPYARMPRDPRMTQDEMIPPWFEQLFGRGGMGSLTPNSRQKPVRNG